MISNSHIFQFRKGENASDKNKMLGHFSVIKNNF